MDNRVKGQIHGISLDSFLQMVQMDKANCTLRVHSGTRTGTLYVRKGELIAAETGDETGEKAAFQIIGWKDATIEIENECKRDTREIHLPLMHILMESLKIQDELNLELSRMNASQGERPAEVVHMPAPGPSFADESAGEASYEFEGEVSGDEADDPEYGMLGTVRDLEPVVGGGSKKNLLGSGADSLQEKKEDSSGSSRFLKWVMIVFFSMVLVVLVVIGITMLLQAKKGRDDFEAMLRHMESVSGEAEKEKVVLDFIKTHSDSPFVSNAQKKIDEIRFVVAERGLAEYIDQVAALPVDDQFIERATEIYRQYLEKYPESIFRDDVLQRIDALPQVIDDRDFGLLKKRPEGEAPEDTYKAYCSYFQAHPNGKYTQSVRDMLATLAKKEYDALLENVEECNGKLDWNVCISRLENLIPRYEAYVNISAAVSLKSDLESRQTLQDLKRRSASFGDNFEASERLYSDFLKKYPGSPIAAEVTDLLNDVRIDLQKKAEWDAVYSFSRKRSVNYLDRILRVEEYIAAHGSSPYREQAEAQKKRLEDELNTAILQKREALAQEALARRKAEEERRQAAILAEKQRLYQAEKLAERRVASTGGRFRVVTDGVVQDSMTGLMWTILDSKDFLQGCVVFDDAKKFVDQLDVAGYRDWRLPSPAELAGIYKNSPVFPHQEDTWYWSSEARWKGFNEVVYVVYPLRSSGWKQDMKFKACGFVRAVRKP